MARKGIAGSLLAGIALANAVPAQADTAAELRAELQTMRERIAELEAKMQALEAEQAPALATATPAQADPPIDVTWRGGPQISAASGEFSFRPRGFLQFDTGWVENPNDAIPTQSLGFRARGRRIVFGAEGRLPGGFGYSAQFNFAGGNLDYEDVVITYAPPGTRLQLTAGNFFPLSGLESTTSSRVTSVLEREQGTDAFGLTRRVGLAAAYLDPDAGYLLSAGVFTAPLSAGFDNDMWQASARAAFFPRIGEDGRLHVGVNYQHRKTASGAQSVRYRSRPLTHITDVRFIDTGAIAAAGDDILGVELAGIFGPLHFAAEGHRLWVDGHRAGTAFDPPDGVGLGLFYDEDPTFQTAYAEIGYYLTGETRGYRNGRWDNVRVLRPVGKGGLGALQLNARIDRADLSDRVAPAGAGAPALVNGGIQTGYQMSAIWNPTDYIRLLLQYTHARIIGGPNAAVVEPLSAEPPSERGYSVDSVALRTQVEF